MLKSSTGHHQAVETTERRLVFLWLNTRTFLAAVRTPRISRRRKGTPFTRWFMGRAAGCLSGQRSNCPRADTRTTPSEFYQHWCGRLQNSHWSLREGPSQPLFQQMEARSASFRGFVSHHTQSAGSVVCRRAKYGLVIVNMLTTRFLRFRSSSSSNIVCTAPAPAVHATPASGISAAAPVMEYMVPAPEVFAAPAPQIAASSLVLEHMTPALAVYASPAFHAAPAHVFAAPVTLKNNSATQTPMVAAAGRWAH